MERTQQSRERLTDRQREVLRLIERGHTNGEIAERLGISLQGAKWHVRELLGKFGVESREELIEAAAAGASPFGRVSRWMSALVPASLPKISAAQLIGGLAATVAVGGAGVGFAVRFSGGPEVETPVATPGAAVAAVTTPGPSPAVMPQVTGSVWTPQEALQHARQEVGADIGVSSYDSQFAQPINLDEYVVTQFEWLPAASRYDLPDGDRYWQAEDGKPHDLWLLRYQGSAFDENPHSNRPVNVSVLALIEDGVRAKVVKALSVDVTDASGRPVGAGGGSFRLRSMDARMAAMVSPSGPKYMVAHQNGLADGPTLIVFESQAGSWCLLAQSL